MIAKPAPRAPDGRRVLARRVREALGPVPRCGDWPPVSIVTLTRNGRAHLERLVPRLDEATDYPQIELVVVDNGSDDGSLDYLDAVDTGFPIVVERNRRNVSFSQGCNQGAERASFDLLLFLNNDVEPFEPGWLRELVCCQRRWDAGIVGATLLQGTARASLGRRGYAVQHRGIRFRRYDGCVTAFNQAGAVQAPGWVDTDHPVPAVSAACLLIERVTFEAVGGLTIGFDYGYEDVDLGLKVMATGRGSLCSGRAVAFHHESATRRSDYNHHMRSRRQAHQRLLMTRWGPQLEREYALDRIRHRGFWSERAQPAVAITLGAGHERDAQARRLGDALEQEGWQPAYVERAGAGWEDVPADIDLLLITDSGCGAALPSAVPAVGWVGDDAQAWLRRPWLGRLDVLLAATPAAGKALQRAGRRATAFPADGDWPGRARQLIELLEQRVANLRFCLKLVRAGESGQDVLDRAAGDLRNELEARGHCCRVALFDEWERLDGLTADVTIAFGRRPGYTCQPAQLNVLWMPERVGDGALREGWDLIAVDGDRFARWAGETAISRLLLLPPAGPGRPAPTSAAVDGLLEAIEARIDGTGISKRIGGQWAPASPAAA